jgi:hypothetical protein
LVIYRATLVCFIVLTGLGAWRRRHPASLVFAAACGLNVLNGQWGQATTLGAAVIGGGLALAAAQDDLPEPTLQRPESA